MRAEHVSGMAGVVPRGGEGVRGWQRWTPFAALAWSLIYGVLAAYWAVGGSGFPYATGSASDALGPTIGRLGPVAQWVVVLMAGIPAAAMGVAMLRGLRGGTLRPLFMAAGALVAGSLLLLMTGLTPLVLLAYVPYAVIGLFTGAEVSHRYLRDVTQWTALHQLLCLAGGFLWVAATVSYARSSGDACPSCGRRDSPAGWQRPDRAARWGRTAVYVSMAAPVLYAGSRYAWLLGFALGMSGEDLRRGQGNGMWIAGAFLATFGLVGIVLTFGLVQRWGEVFPRWMIGLAGRRVPIALAVVPASLVSVLLVVGGLVVWSHLPRMVSRLAAGGADGMAIAGAMVWGVGGVLLFPLWGVALAAATLAYYYRRRTACAVCGRGAFTAVAMSEPAGFQAALES